MNGKNPSAPYGLAWHKVFSYAFVPLFFISALSRIQESLPIFDDLSAAIGPFPAVLTYVPDVIIIALAVGTFIGMLRMARFGVFWSNVLLVVLILYAFSSGFLLNYDPVTRSVDSTDLLCYAVPASVAPIVLLCVNHSYYRKRAVLFH